MQAILIVLPILVFGLLTAILLLWVLFVTLPRLRRAERKRAAQANRHAS